MYFLFLYQYSYSVINIRIFNLTFKYIIVKINTFLF
jgi:hypothetical protein